MALLYVYCAEYAKPCSVKFVWLAREIYNKDILICNVRSIWLFGALDNISWLPFENYLQCTKTLLRRRGSRLSNIYQS